ncbi:MAG TPA: hypothetical protein VK943_08565, partial [Arenibaculum sp.]|nr:hypothetical protein [Arenibaculum sp.]
VYGSAVWLLGRGPLGWYLPVGLLLVLLSAVEAAQTHLVDRTPEITDPLLVILLAAVMHRFLESRSS